MWTTHRTSSNLKICPDSEKRRQPQSRFRRHAETKTSHFGRRRIGVGPSVGLAMANSNCRHGRPLQLLARPCSGRCILCSSKAEYPRLTWGISRYFEPAEGPLAGAGFCGPRQYPDEPCCCRLMRRRVGLAASAAVRSGLQLLCVKGTRLFCSCRTSTASLQTVCAVSRPCTLQVLQTLAKGCKRVAGQQVRPRDANPWTGVVSLCVPCLFGSSGQ